MNKYIGKKALGLLVAGQILSLASSSYAAPSRYIGKNIINKWDYHQTNYDKNGQVRYRPGQSTFDTENQGQTPTDPGLPSISIADTKLGEDIIIKLDMDQPRASDWLGKITRIVRTNSKIPNNQKLEQEVSYSIREGNIVLDHKSRPINGLNGVHILKIYAQGYEAKEVPIHIVKAGSIELDGNSKSLAHNDLIFRLKDFNYGIENPIYGVELDGQSLVGGCVDYHILSDLVRLENNSLARLTPGAHILKVKAIGYQDFILDFYLYENKNYQTSRASSHPETDSSLASQLIETLKAPLAQPRLSMDAISAATKTSPSDGLDGSSGATASTTQNIDLVFDFDLLSNALILEEINKSTPNSREIVRLWEDTNKLYIQKDQDEQGQLYTYSGFKNALNKSMLKGQQLSFEAYIASGLAEKSGNRSYNYKFVLEDGLYGEVLAYGQIDALDYELSLVGSPGLKDEINLSLDRQEILARLDRIIVNNNQLAGTDYSIEEGNKLTIKNSANYLQAGQNKISIYAPGFRNKTIDVFLEKSKVNPRLEEDNQGLKILELDQAYLKNLEGISLNGRGLFPNLDYSIEGDIIRLNQDLFKADSSYSLSLKSYGYRDISLNYQSKGPSLPEEEETLEDQPKTRPGFIKRSTTIDLASIQSSNAIRLEEVLVENFEKDRLTFSINGEEIKTGLSLSRDFFGQAGNIDFSIDPAKLFKEAHNQLVISYPGYDDLTITVLKPRPSSPDPDWDKTKDPEEAVEDQAPKEDPSPSLEPASPFQFNRQLDLTSDKIHLVLDSSFDLGQLDIDKIQLLYRGQPSLGLSFEKNILGMCFIGIDKAALDIKPGDTISLSYPNYRDLVLNFE